MKCPSKRSLILGLAAITTACSLAGPAQAQSPGDYPNRPVTIIVGFTAGGPTDATARILAEQLSVKFGQTFLVDNKPGASASIAALLVKKAKPDGYTLMFASNGALTINPQIERLAYDPVRDFVPIGLVANYPYFVVTSAASPIHTLDDLLKKGRNPESDLTFASAGVGVLNHLAGEWFSHEAQIKAKHIPYKGDSATIADLIAGRVDFAFLAGAAVFPQVKAGKLRILASASATPGRGGDGVITLSESGFKGFAAEPWNGLMGPASLPPQIVVKLNAAINDIMNRKDVAERLAVMDVHPLTGTPDQFTDRIKEETLRWGQVIKTADIKTE
ncbi:MAG: tripartite tricarboxylate transporter substrate binding protein [Burkholderiaceae bacterium]|jgi:tripartite-type tricarboxylate transporter receptor subunit TctC|nr:tripartite tricarboxylate transporter substrate binding protein [Burkholderiaceae bacterium]